MRSQRSIVRKAAKKRRGRRDYERRANINKYARSALREEHVEKYRSTTRGGVVTKEHVGYKTVFRKVKDHYHKDKDGDERQDSIGRGIGMISYPMPRKVHGIKY